MRAIRFSAAALAIALLLALPATTLAANRYVGYVACSTSKSAPPKTSCSKASPKTAFFKSKSASVTYQVCVKFPTGTKLCAVAQSAPKGVKIGNAITSNIKGTHVVTWKVAGVKVATWTFKVI